MHKLHPQPTSRNFDQPPWSFWWSLVILTISASRLYSIFWNLVEICLSNITFTLETALVNCCLLVAYLVWWDLLRWWLWDYIKETPTNSGNFSYIGNVGNETIYRPSLTIDLHHLYSGWIPNLKTEASLVVWSWPEVPQVDTAEVVAPYFWSSFSSLATPVIVIIGVLEFNINDGPTLGCDWSTYCSGKNYNSLLFSVMTI